MRSSQIPTTGETGMHYCNGLLISPKKTVPLVQCGCKLGVNALFELLLVPLDTITRRAKQPFEFSNCEEILGFSIQTLKLYSKFCLSSF